MHSFLFGSPQPRILNKGLANTDVNVDNCSSLYSLVSLSIDPC